MWPSAKAAMLAVRTRVLYRPPGMAPEDQSPERETLYQHAGGDEALHRLEKLFYEKALADRVLKTLFTKRVPTHVDQLTWFTAESFGGPDRFTRRLGFQHIIDVHRRLKITDEQRERFVALYLDALDEADLPNDEPFRTAVHEHVEFGAGVAQQNSWAETEADLHPIREVPHWEWPA
jgi:hemoglobin